ncbi:S1 RNA-binding domain-containing protein [Lactobacillus corticis]|uniref:RNA-binding protein n=1 Tax=Lactobacillus corticis TaxID=2201249 RepID=A0A916QK21_9LACO|nr:S1 RNA-binding domain-containing protein [Lactobacillus corticis]GFZ26830.1 RNA-binding protein [Lactobacillus corticis]
MKYQVGQRVNGIVNNVTDFGIFLTLPGRQHGLVHHQDFGENWLRERNRYEVGQVVRVVVEHRHQGKLSLSIKRVNDPSLPDPTNEFTGTQPQDFARVLTATLQTARKEIARNQAVLTNDPLK